MGPKVGTTDISVYTKTLSDTASVFLPQKQHLLLPVTLHDIRFLNLPKCVLVLKRHKGRTGSAPRLQKRDSK